MWKIFLGTEVLKSLQPKCHTPAPPTLLDICVARAQQRTPTAAGGGFSLGSGPAMRLLVRFSLSEITIALIRASGGAHPITVITAAI